MADQFLAVVHGRSSVNHRPPTYATSLENPGYPCGQVLHLSHADQCLNSKLRLTDIMIMEGVAQQSLALVRPLHD